MKRHDLIGPLRQLLPTPDQTEFLRAALLEGEAGRRAWRQWQAAALGSGTSLEDELQRLNFFLPLLGWNLKRNQVIADRALTTILRASHLTEEVRWRGYREVCRVAFEALEEGRIPCIVLKGAALCELAYPSPLLRHSGDVDLLVHSSDLQRAAGLLIARGWRWSAFRNPDPGHHHLHPLEHPSGLPLDLHDRLLIRYYRLDGEQLWTRSRQATIAGHSVRTLSPEDGVIHLCAHAMASSPILRWVPDVWFLLEKHPELSWPALVERTCAARIELPMFVALDYLAREIGMAVPEAVLATLQHAAERTGYLGRAAARPWAFGDVSEIWSQPHAWWRRAITLATRAFPSPVQLLVRLDLRPWEVPYYYVHRIWRYAVRTTQSPGGSPPPRIGRPTGEGHRRAG